MANRLTLVIFSLMFAQPVFSMGHKVEIDSKLFFDGKKVGSPRIFATSGEKSKIIMNDQKNNREYSLEVLPTRGAGNNIQLRYSLAIREKNNETITRGTFQIRPNKKARISIDHGRIQIHLKVKKS